MSDNDAQRPLTLRDRLAETLHDEVCTYHDPEPVLCGVDHDGEARRLLSREPLAQLAVLEPKPGRWAFLDPETGDWIEVRDGTVWAAALGKEPTP